MGTRDHRHKAPKSVTIAILSASSSRSLKEDASGLWMANRARKEGHRVVLHELVPDDAGLIAQTVIAWSSKPEADVVLLTGGTGISPRDVTLEAVRPLFAKELSAFACLFSQLSFEQVDAAAILSRAAAGIVGRTVVFCLPGSLKACKLACRELIFPELGHLVGHLHEG
jgi:molybdenum cofactor biosynthesis protein B